MKTRTIAIALTAFVWAAPAALHAQFTLGGRPVQIHGFASQGFAYTNDNNYLTMKTRNGSFAFTDGAVNVSTPITDKFRVGAQMYLRNIGELGQWRPELDWATVDYKFTSWFGLRGGKVKTALGLYHDTQDMTFIHTWAILPQSLYPLDLRSSTIAHTGGDVYGDVSLKRFGGISYTVYAGRRPDDAHGGYRYTAANIGLAVDGAISGYMYGVDLRWNTPVQGLTMGASRLFLNTSGRVGMPGIPLKGVFHSDRYASAFYSDYLWGKLHLSGEYRRTIGPGELRLIRRNLTDFDVRGGYLAAAYRVSKRLELGTYYSRYVPDRRQPVDPPNGHIYDRTVTARIDLSKHWDVKVEGHFMDGYGSPLSAAGFYLAQNRQGYQPKTNLLVVRTTYVF